MKEGAKLAGRPPIPHPYRDHTHTMLRMYRTTIQCGVVWQRLWWFLWVCANARQPMRHNTPPDFATPPATSPSALDRPHWLVWRAHTTTLERWLLNATSAAGAARHLCSCRQRPGLRRLPEPQSQLQSVPQHARERATNGSNIGKGNGKKTPHADGPRVPACID